MQLKELPPKRYDELVNSVADSIKDFYTVEYNPSRPWEVASFAEHLCRRVAKALEEQK